MIDDELVDRLMAQVDAEGLELLGPEGVLADLTSRILCRVLDVEMTDHLGYERGYPAGVGVREQSKRQVPEDGADRRRHSARRDAWGPQRHVRAATGTEASAALVRVQRVGDLAGGAENDRP